MKIRLGGAAACALVGLAGCSNFQEVHYLQQPTEAGAQPNYYRVTVKGWTALGSSRYVSGYFDNKAVETYFGGFTQKADAPDFLGGTTPPAAEPIAEKKDGTVQPLGSNPNDPPKSLILLLSSNSDAIADSLTALEQSDAITKSLAHLLAGDKFTAADESDDAAALDQSSGKSLVTLGKTLLPTVDAEGKVQPDIKPDAVKANLLTYANSLAAAVSPGTHFKDFSEAKAWLDNFHPANGGGK